ncbi:hypothetical protein M422DRAFT_24138 [Sphaerobolus stellatus SS14]|nr:hypothetical protein M422DRAFT_24138 [Sphaerobolus stellatus SS14]
MAVIPWGGLIDELWFTIVVVLSQKELSSLGQTSRRFSELCRPPLFRKVKVNQNNAKGPLSLLAREKHLARQVEELIIERTKTDHEETDNPLLNVQAISNMIFLKSIRIYGVICRNEDEAYQFGLLISQRPLESLFYTNNTMLPSIEIGQGYMDGIRALTNIVWDDASESSVEPMFKMLTNSRETLESIALPFRVRFVEFYDPLWRMRFPRLRTFLLGPWVPYSTTHGPRISAELTTFILSHGESLTGIDIEYREHDGMDSLCFLSSSYPHVINQDALPNLTYFRGHSSFITSMANMGMLSLANALENLVVGAGEFSPMLEFRHMFEAVKAHDEINSFAALKQIYIDFSGVGLEKGRIKKIVKLCAECCGDSLEIWHGMIPGSARFTFDEFYQLFEPFKKLRVLHYDSRSVLQGPGGTSMHMRLLGTKCSTLEEVYLYQIPWTADRWQIYRNKERGVTGVFMKTFSLRDRRDGRFDIREEI